MVDVSDSRYNEQMAALYDALAGSGRASDAATIVEDEARLWLKQAINFTPPRNKAQGENAIKTDLKKIFSVVHDDVAQHIAAEWGTNNVDHWLTSEVDGHRYNVVWDKLDVQGLGMDEYHANHRDSRGRAYSSTVKRSNNKWRAPYVVSQSAFDAFYNKTKQLVGLMKSGWMRAYYEVGGKLPSWIQRQASRSMGGVVNELSVPGNPSITMSNHAPGIASFDRIARETFRARREAMAKRIRLILSGYNKDMAAGMRPRKHAVRTADSYSVA